MLFSLSSATLLSFFLSILATRTNALSSTPPQRLGETTRNVATQVLQGTGQVQVDLNQYNLQSLEQIEEEWTANLVQKVGEQSAQPKLGCKTDSTLYVDAVQVSFPRLPDQGLGLQLVELAGGREDGLGITLISGLVSGGSAAAAAREEELEAMNILPGDSISQVSVIRQQRLGTTDTEEEFVVQTECLSYDNTVAAIQSLPPRASSDKYDEYFALTLKRIRRKPKVTVTLQFPPKEEKEDATITLFAGENLRYGMLIRGVELNDPLAKRFDTKNSGNCGAGGLCRTCSVAVQNGADLLNPQRLAEQQMLADNPRWRLGCKAIVGYGMKEGNINIRVNPRQW